MFCFDITSVPRNIFLGDFIEDALQYGQGLRLFAVWTVVSSPFIKHMRSALLLNSLVQEMKVAKGKYVCS